MADQIVDTSRLIQRYYKLSITFIDNGINEELSEKSISNLSIEYDFRSNLLPVLRIQVVLTQKLHSILLEHRNSLKIKIHLSSYIHNDKSKTTEIIESGKVIHIDDLFQPIIGDMNESTMDSLRDKNVDNSKEPAFYTDLYLFNSNAMNINKKIINFVAKDCKVKNAIGYIFKTCGIKKVLMNAPDNDEQYAQLIVPPMNLKNSIQSISDNYGIYSNGIRQFYDFDTYYLLPNSLNNLPILNGEYQNVYVNVTKYSNAGSTNEGYYSDTRQNCYVINALNTINITNSGSSNKEINGNIVKTYNRSDLEQAASYDSESGKFTFNKGYSEINIDVDGYGNSDKVTFAVDRQQASGSVNNFKTQVQHSNTEFTLTFNTIDLSMFKINRIFIFRFEEAKFSTQYNGRYMLEAMTFVMEKQQGQIQAICKFRKVD